MKRRKLLKHLHRHGCFLRREGSRHGIYVTSIRDRVTEVPRHPEINLLLVRKICKDLDVPVSAEK